MPSQQIHVAGLGERRAVPAAWQLPCPHCRGTCLEAERSGGQRLPTPQHPASPSHPGATGSGLAGGISLYFAFPDIATTIRAWHGAVHVGFGSLFTSFTPTFWWVVAHFSSFEKALILVLFTQPHVSPPTPIYGSRKKTSVTTQQGPHNILVFLRVLLVASCHRPGLGSKGSGCCLS